MESVKDYFYYNFFFVAETYLKLESIFYSQKCFQDTFYVFG